MSGYSGAPWRSRFLRSPKIGLELAARPDFVALGDSMISRVQLGAKTGCDDFFFLTVSGRATSAGRIRLRGLGGWEGDFPKSDVLPGVQTPKELDTPAGRAFTVPRGGFTYYLYPRVDRVDKTVREYVDYGEAQNIHKRNLVKANAERLASGQTAWWRQTRALVRSRWAMPYNSGYAFEVVDNEAEAVLNGRLVGVQPAAGVDPVVLGGVLNSTFVTLMRLLEGVATGNEGAFDVGPPAARLIRIPDPRIVASTGAEEILRIIVDIRKAGVVPAAPSARGDVPDLRRRLDLAVLAGLGLERGDAAVLLERVYGSYARWRAAVESVEDQMQVHRRALAHRGGARQENPAARAGRTVWDEMSPAAEPLLAGVEASGFDLVDPVMPRAEASQTALFDSTIVLDVHRQRLDLVHPERVQLADYMRRVGITGPFPLPFDPSRCARLLAEAKLADVAFLTEATRRAKSHVSDDLVEQAAALAHRAWVSMSISRIRQAALHSEDAEPDPSLFFTEGLVPPSRDK